MQKFFLFILFAAAIIFPRAAFSDDENDKRVDDSIRRALDFIAAGQLANGTFNSPAAQRFSGVPALCGMAFLAVGDVPGSEPNGRVVEKIIDYILDHAPENGYLGYGGGKMYSHCISTLFLSEVSGMVDTNRQARIDALLPKMVKIILTAQQVNKPNAQYKGGWRYEPNSMDSDMSCSGWAIMALRSARLNGAPVPDEAIDQAMEYVLRRHDSKRGTFGYQDTATNADSLTGAGLLCLELCGRHGTPATLQAGQYLAKNFRNLERIQYKLYGLYYTSQGLFQIGGEPWKNFSEWMYDYLIPRQKPNGSWEMGEPGACVYYQTALVVLAFSVPYRQLPIYQRDETVDETQND